MELLTKPRMQLYRVYAMSRLPGPPFTKPLAMEMNVAVPILPPMAMSWT